MKIAKPLILCLMLALVACANHSSSVGFPKAHTNDYWEQRIARVHRGMKRSDVEELLPIHSPPQEKRIPQGHADVYAVDSEWSVEVPYDFNGFIDDERKNPYLVMHLYENRVIGPVKLVRKHTRIDWTLYPPTP